MSPRILSTQATMPPMPPGGLEPKPIGEWLQDLVMSLNDDRVKVGDRIERRILYGTSSEFPDARGGGDIYYDTTIGYLYVDTGTWDAVGSAVAAHDHNDIYYTKTQLDGGQLDNRYYTESEVDGLLHAESHTIVSHSDTTGTGAELNELTDGSTTTLHNHGTGAHTHVEADITDLDHDDTDAIHDNVSGEIQALTGVTPEDADKVLIEDDSASYAKRRTSMSNIYSYVEGKMGGPFLPLAGGTMTGPAIFGTGAWVDLRTQPTTPPTGRVYLGRSTGADHFRMVTVDGYMDMGPSPLGVCILSSDLDELYSDLDWQFSDAGATAVNRFVQFENSGSTMRDGIKFSRYDAFSFGDDACTIDLRGSATRPLYKGSALALLSDTGGVGTFIGHSDTPSTFVGQAGKVLRVNSTPNAVEFAFAAGIDTTAIHDNLANEITAVTAITALADADEFLLEDASASYAKRAIRADNIAVYVGNELGLSGGPFLPLSAGASYPLTGDLYVGAGNDVFCRERYYVYTGSSYQILAEGDLDDGVVVGPTGSLLTLRAVAWINVQARFVMNGNRIDMNNGALNMGTGNILGDYGSTISLKDSGATARLMCWMSGSDRIFGNTDGGTTWIEGSKLKCYRHGYSGLGLPNTSSWGTAGSWGIHVQSSTGRVFLAFNLSGTVKAVELIASPYHIP